MDKKTRTERNVILNNSEDTLLNSTSKYDESKHTQVFVLPPEVLKGLLLESKKPKIDVPNKLENSDNSRPNKLLNNQACLLNSTTLSDIAETSKKDLDNNTDSVKPDLKNNSEIYKTIVNCSKESVEKVCEVSIEKEEIHDKLLNKANVSSESDLKFCIKKVEDERENDKCSTKISDTEKINDVTTRKKKVKNYKNTFCTKNVTLNVNDHETLNNKVHIEPSITNTYPDINQSVETEIHKLYNNSTSISENKNEGNLENFDQKRISCRKYKPRKNRKSLNKDNEKLVTKSNRLKDSNNIIDISNNENQIHEIENNSNLKNDISIDIKDVLENINVYNEQIPSNIVSSNQTPHIFNDETTTHLVEKKTDDKVNKKDEILSTEQQNTNNNKISYNNDTDILNEIEYIVEEIIEIKDPEINQEICDERIDTNVSVLNFKKEINILNTNDNKNHNEILKVKHSNKIKENKKKLIKTDEQGELISKNDNINIYNKKQNYDLVITDHEIKNSGEQCNRNNFNETELNKKNRSKSIDISISSHTKNSRPRCKSLSIDTKEFCTILTNISHSSSNVLEKNKFVNDGVMFVTDESKKSREITNIPVLSKDNKISNMKMITLKDVNQINSEEKSKEAKVVNTSENKYQIINENKKLIIENKFIKNKMQSIDINKKCAKFHNNKKTDCDFNNHKIRRISIDNIIPEKSEISMARIRSKSLNSSIKLSTENINSISPNKVKCVKKSDKIILNTDIKEEGNKEVPIDKVQKTLTIYRKSEEKNKFEDTAEINKVNSKIANVSTRNRSKSVNNSICDKVKKRIMRTRSKSSTLNPNNKKFPPLFITKCEEDSINKGKHQQNSVILASIETNKTVEKNNIPNNKTLTKTLEIAQGQILLNSEKPENKKTSFTTDISKNSDNTNELCSSSKADVIKLENCKGDTDMDPLITEVQTVNNLKKDILKSCEENLKSNCDINKDITPITRDSTIITVKSEDVDANSINNTKDSKVENNVHNISFPTESYDVTYENFFSGINLVPGRKKNNKIEVNQKTDSNNKHIIQNRDDISKCNSFIDEIGINVNKNTSKESFLKKKVSSKNKLQIDEGKKEKVCSQKKRRGRPPKLEKSKTEITEKLGTKKSEYSENNLQEMHNSKETDKSIEEDYLKCSDNSDNASKNLPNLNSRKGRPRKSKTVELDVSTKQSNIKKCNSKKTKSILNTNHKSKIEELDKSEKIDDSSLKINTDDCSSINENPLKQEDTRTEFTVKNELSLSNAEPRKNRKHSKNNEKDICENNSSKININVSEVIENNLQESDIQKMDVHKETSNLCSTEKKKRGRPRKSDISNSSFCVDATNEKIIKENVNKHTLKTDIDKSSTENNENLMVPENTRKRKRSLSFHLDNNTITNQEDFKFIESSNEKSTNSSKRSLRNPKVVKKTDMVDGKEFSDESENKSDNDESEKHPRKKKKCSFSINKTKKKGRPKGSQRNNKCDDDYVPHHMQVQPPSKSKDIKSNSSSKTAMKKTVTCGKCGIQILQNQWANHNLSVHNDLGWIEGTIKPDFDNDDKLVKRVLSNALKKRKGKLSCEMCKDSKRSVLGFLSHITFCGKDEEEKRALMITCPICNAVTKPSSLEYHERMHKLQAEQKETTASTEIDNLGLKGKRRAAEKAITKISEVTASVVDDSIPPDKKLKLDIDRVKKLIRKPQFKKNIPNSIIGKWKKQISNGQDVTCSQLGCLFSTKSLDGIKDHYSMCNFTVQKNFTCKICQFQTLSEEEIVKHAIEKHSAEDKDDTNLSISDMESSASECGSEIENTHEKSQSSSKQYLFKESTDSSNKMFKFLFKDGVCNTQYNKPFFSAFQWTLKFERKNYKFNLFKEYLPNSFELLNVEESKTYMPELNESMPMKSITMNNRNPIESEWKKWKRFEGQYIEDNPTFFVGGPVWAIAWLPIPSSLAFSENISQFIAISTHPTMEQKYSSGEVYSGKNIIQIWNLGNLSHNGNSCTNPQLAYAIAHEGGTIWCLEWCPSGCYQHESLSDFIKDNNQQRRMGLLAAACSDGCVRVYSLSFPEDLPHDTKNTDNSQYSKSSQNFKNKYPIFKTEPILILTVNIDMYDKKQQQWQVTKLSWCKENEHNIIVAGLSNGYVALWDLTSKSPLLRFKRNNTVFLNPYRHFLAHHHAVTMVYLVPQDNKRFLVTASLDRYYKFWDLEDISNPKNSIKKSFVTNGAWLNHWCCALIAYDDALSMNHNYSYCFPLREYTYKYYNIFPNNSTSYSISTSDFGNSIANGTLAGEVLAMFPQQLLYFRNMDKILPRKRYISRISSIEVTDFQKPSEDNKLLNNKKQGDKNDKTQYNFMPSTYNESKNRFGLKFCDKLSNFRDECSQKPKIHKKTLTCEMMQTVPIEQYPFTSVNRIAWNPNAWSFLWLAVGYQNGFVRLIHFKSLASTAEWNKLLNVHINKLKSKNEDDL